MIKLLPALATMEQERVRKALYTALAEMIAQVFDPVEALRISAADPMATASVATALEITIPATPIAAPQPVDPLDSHCAVSFRNNH